MKRHILFALIAVGTVWTGSLSAKPLKHEPEYYGKEVRKAEENGDYQRVKALFEEIAESDNIDRVIGKGVLFNIYQGKCSGLSNAFYHSRAKPEHMANCQSFTNLKKSLVVLEDVANDLASNMTECIQKLGSRFCVQSIVYATKNLSRVYETGEPAVGAEQNARKAQKYQAIYDQYKNQVE